MTPQLKILTSPAALQNGWHKAFSTPEEAEAMAVNENQAAYYHCPQNKMYYVPFDPKKEATDEIAQKPI